jgi:LysR family glycine cleavage system transcriptional activator
LVDQAGAPRPAQTLRFNQTGLALDAAVNGQGVALAPAVLARADIEAGRLEELWRADEGGPHGYYIVTPKSADSVAIEAMSKWLKTLVS